MAATPHTSPVLPGAPAAEPVRALTAWWAQHVGRRDAAGPAPDPTTGHLPYTRRLHGRAAAAEATISQVLHHEVTPVDQTFIALCAQIVHHNQAVATAHAAAAAIPAGAEPGSLLAAARAREGRRLCHEAASNQQAIADLTGRVAGLLATRRHLVNQARDLVDGHAARYRELVAAHRRGYDRPKRRAAASTGAPHPAYVPTATWVAGDLPILTATIDPATREVAQWTLREFENPEPPALHLRAV